MSHIRAVRSKDAVTMRLPSGLNAALDTGPVWPLSGWPIGFLQPDVVQDPIDEFGRFEQKPRRFGRCLERRLEIVPAHRRDVDLLLRQERGEERIAD
jgi:hypothetical protein